MVHSDRAQLVEHLCVLIVLRAARASQNRRLEIHPALPIQQGRGLLDYRSDGSNLEGANVSNRLAAEAFGTFWLVLGGCGSAVLAAAPTPQSGIGMAGVALAFGLTVLTMAYAVGHISGAHFNPAVTVGLWAGGRFSSKDVVPYIVAQVIGGIAAAAVLYGIASGKAGFSATDTGFAANGFGEHSPAGYGLSAAILSEFVLTAFFVIVIHGATDERAPKGFAPIAIGLALTLIHLISIPVTNTSVNPARSTAVAIFQGTWALHQLWLFWVVPIAGGVIGGFVYRFLFGQKSDAPAVAAAAADASAAQ
ncbi:aquaporin Z [Burkholderia dolosa]|nr:aquaporin Z [Burkholderia dolosa]